MRKDCAPSGLVNFITRIRRALPYANVCKAFSLPVKRVNVVANHYILLRRFWAAASHFPIHKSAALFKFNSMMIVAIIGVA